MAVYKAQWYALPRVGIRGSVKAGEILKLGRVRVWGSLWVPGSRARQSEGLNSRAAPLSWSLAHVRSYYVPGTSLI